MTVQATMKPVSQEERPAITGENYEKRPVIPMWWGWLTGHGDPVLATARLTVVLSGLVICSAGVLGFTALHDLFIAIGLFHPFLGYLFPVLFDAAEVTFAISTLNAHLQGEEDRHAWRMVISFTLLGIMANVAHAIFAGITGTITTQQATLAVIFTSLFPLSIALVTHNLKNAIKRQIRRNTLVKTLTQLTYEIVQEQTHLNLLAEQIAHQRHQFETERSALEQQKVRLEQEISQLKKAQAEAKSGTYPATSETERKAYEYLVEQVRAGRRNKEINGAEVGRVSGTSDSFGRRLKKQLLPQVRSDLNIAEPAPHPNGTHPIG